MRIFTRIVGLAALAAFSLLRIWIGVLGLAELIGIDWAIVLALALLLLRLKLPLQIAVFFGALAVWHWPVVAVILAAPRLILVLPGLISTLLASTRHPRPRWRSFDAA
jgi:hypothetical protein